MKYFLTILFLSTSAFASRIDDVRWFVYSEHYKMCNEIYDYEINHHFCPDYWEKRGMVKAYEKIIEQIED